MNLTRLAGNGPLKRQLELETARRGLSHAYILSGPAGSGKRTLAGLLAAALVCTGGGERPCLSCPGCRKALAGIHPDIVRAGDDGKDISVAQVRQLRADAYIRPNEADRKVYILEKAQTMNPSAQNAMLKLLEEGPAYAAFLLLTDNAAALLPTVRSRCELLPLSPVTEAEAEDWLAGRFPDRSPEERRQAARRCEGLLGRAVAQLEGQAGGEDKALAAALELVRRLAARDELALAELCVTAGGKVGPGRPAAAAGRDRPAAAGRPALRRRRPPARPIPPAGGGPERRRGPVPQGPQPGGVRGGAPAGRPAPTTWAPATWPAGWPRR